MSASPHRCNEPFFGTYIATEAALTALSNVMLHCSISIVSPDEACGELEHMRNTLRGSTLRSWGLALDLGNCERALLAHHPGVRPCLLRHEPRLKRSRAHRLSLANGLPYCFPIHP